jgi:hypothetical protein
MAHRQACTTFPKGTVQIREISWPLGRNELKFNCWIEKKAYTSSFQKLSASLKTFVSWVPENVLKGLSNEI